jgi:glycosyltransferase involved in cell wall biosynthesis
MRIGVNTVFLIPGRVGGSETYLIDTLRHMAPLRRDVEWVLFTTVENDAPLRERFRDDPNVQCVALGLRASGKLMRVVGEQTMLPAACRREAVSVLWSPGYTAPLALALPQVVSVLDMQYCEFPEDFSWPARWALRAIVPRAARRSRWVLTLSAFSRDQIIRHARVAPDRIRVIHLGVDGLFLAAMTEGDRQERIGRHVPAGPYLLCVANTHPHKNVAALIRAFGMMPQHQRHRLVLVGVAGRGEPEVRDALHGSSANDRVIRLSGLPRPDLVALYQGARVFAFPSLYEGFGLPVLEAMAARVPVVAVRRAPMTEVGGEAIAYADGTPEDLARVLSGVLALDDPARQAWVERAALRAAGFTWDKTARATLDCLLEAGAVQAGV